MIRSMRRGALVLAVSILLVMGFGAAYAVSGALKGHTPATICHKPGTPAEHTITVDDDAVPAHLAHGDYLGPCQPTEPTEPQETTLTSETTTTVPITETIPPSTITEPPETM